MVEENLTYCVAHVTAGEASHDPAEEVAATTKACQLMKRLADTGRQRQRVKTRERAIIHNRRRYRIQ